MTKATPTMTPEQEAAWVAAAQGGTLMQHVGFMPSDVTYRDRAEVCGHCGRAFVWTVAKQIGRAQRERRGLSRLGLPPFCSTRCAQRNRRGPAAASR